MTSTKVSVKVRRIVTSAEVTVEVERDNASVNVVVTVEVTHLVSVLTEQHQDSYITTLTREPEADKKISKSYPVHEMIEAFLGTHPSTLIACLNLGALLLS